MNTKRFISFSTILLTTVSSVFSQCIVGGTEFNTEPELCNPTMVSDDNEENGWFSAKVAEIIAKQCSNSNFFEHPSNVIQKGLPSNKLSVVGNASLTWKELLNARTPSGSDTGLVVVTSNPKLISPYLSEGSGSAMLVAMGNGHEFPFFTYTVEGLVPNSTVTMTADVYDLLDINELETALKAMNSGVTSAKDYITEIPLPYGGSYRVQLNAGKLDYSQSRINGLINNQFTITGATTTNNGMAPTGMGVASVTPTNGGKQMSISAKADNTGAVSFYLWRNPGGNARPIGLDNITIEGELMPVIKAGESPCPMNPYTMRLSSTYPAGTTYSWKVAEDGSQTSDMATFSFIPKIASKYNVTCDVTLPGCMSAKSKTFTFETNKNCCETADGTPLSITTIYKNDFGQFIGSNYVYSDAAGNDYSVPVTESSYCGILQNVIKNQLDSTINVPYNKDFCTSGDAYVITTEDPYSGSGGDHTGNGNGGMLIMDLKTTGWKNKAIFKKEIENLCKGIRIYFSAAVQAFNDITGKPGNPTSIGTLELVLKSASGSVLASSGEVTLTKPGWIDLSSEVILPKDEKSVTLELISLEDDYTGDGRGDIAVDDIKIQVCAPPAVEIRPNLSGEELLNLCSDKEFILKAVTSEAVKKYYQDINYLFQWTTDDPSVVKQPNWHDLGYPSTDDAYVFKNPVNEEPFLSSVNRPDTRLFFRLVVGDKSVLTTDRDWEDMNVQSPCRPVSISNIPIVASLNCPVCVAPDEVVITMKGNGKYDSIKSILYLCPGDSAQFEVGEIIGTDADNKSYYNYVASWHKDDIKSTPLMKKACSDADNQGPALSITYDNVIAGGANEAKYILLIHDNNDPSLSSTPCDHADTLRVIAASEPRDTLTDPDPFCEGTLASEPEKRISGYDISWYEDKEITKKISEPEIASVTVADSPKSYYYVLTDTKTGCQSDINEYTVKVASVPAPLIEGSIVYQKSEGENGGFKMPTEQNPDAIKNDSDCIIVWYKKDNAGQMIQINEADATPVYNSSMVEDEMYTYYITQINKMTGCESKPFVIHIIVEATPTSLTNTPAKAVSITPNPASTKVSVIAEEAVEKVEILNMVGEVVKVSNRKDIDTSNLSNGVYFVRTTINDETTVHKLVINK
ncbi:MAG: T9SS type A sorting domain-containing protein [Paludibacteraceae bacterium]|nr:T9SS type A sorting domain-containing protein [Paludibacteraceae bacterium]